MTDALETPVAVPAKRTKAKTRSTAKRKGKGKKQNGPKVTGVNLQTRMIRVTVDFADWLDREAKRAGVNRTTASQTLYESLT